MKTINVLDKGFVRIADESKDVTGDDLAVVNAARVSYESRSNELNEKDIRLIHFLAREGHSSPFRHCRVKFEIYAPLFVARQWWRYTVDGATIEEGTPWSESSRRYIKENLNFYVPSKKEWREKPENSKQGSGDFIEELSGSCLTKDLIEHLEDGEKLYKNAIDNNVAPEQARLFLPAYGMYVRWIWSPSLQTITHFLNQRLASDAQKEIQDYAKAVKQLVQPHFPHSLEALLNE